MNLSLGPKKIILRMINRPGYQLIKYPIHIPIDFDKNTIGIINKVMPFSKTSPERISALCEAVKYVVRARIPGDIVECGVWKGGSIMAIEYTFA